MVRVLAVLLIPAFAAQASDAQPARPPSPAPDGTAIIVDRRMPPRSVPAPEVRGGQSCPAALAPERVGMAARDRLEGGTNRRTGAWGMRDCSGATMAVAQVSPPAAVTRPETPEIPAGPRHAAPPAGVPAPTPEAHGDDIVVVARKLRRLRLHYASSGRILGWCHADISSGDRRVDRIGCAILRACVREDNDTTVAALACFRRKVDEIDPPPA